MARRLGAEVRRRVIQLAAQGKTYREIIDDTGVSMGAVSLIVKPLGGVIRPELWSTSSKRLSLRIASTFGSGWRRGCRSPRSGGGWAG